jgi:FlaA1/EpsC-like NDP-sugar epimerase
MKKIFQDKTVLIVGATGGLGTMLGRKKNM